jgi:hypothetical protein
MTQADVITKIKDLVKDSSKYKIGKTGQELEDRFDTDYKEEFDSINYICHHDTDEELIDKWEKDLIAHFTSTDKRCVNDANGGGEMTGVSGRYRIYIVMKK